MKISIRAETRADSAAIALVLERVFRGPAEARLVEELRDAGALSLSLVAGAQGSIVGHIAFSPVSLSPEQPAISGLGLAPMAVLPDFQRKGIGSELIRAGLDACRQSGLDFVVVLGHPEYYPRFGFVPGPPRGIRCVYPVPDEVFMIQELTPGALSGATGLVHYHAAFAAFE